MFLFTGIVVGRWKRDITVKTGSVRRMDVEEAEMLEKRLLLQAGVLAADPCGSDEKG